MADKNPADLPITINALGSWLKPLVIAGGLLVTGTTAWLSMDARVTAVEHRAPVDLVPRVAVLERTTSDQATAGSEMVRQLKRIERLLTAQFCGAEPKRCREFMAELGAE